MSYIKGHATPHGTVMFISVYLQTPKEREKKLLDELKKRRDEGEENLILVDGRIVTRRQLPQNVEGTQDQSRVQRQNTTSMVHPTVKPVRTKQKQTHKIL